MKQKIGCNLGTSFEHNNRFKVNGNAEARLLAYISVIEEENVGKRCLCMCVWMKRKKKFQW